MSHDLVASEPLTLHAFAQHLLCVGSVQATVHTVPLGCLLVERFVLRNSPFGFVVVVCWMMSDRWGIARTSPANVWWKGLQHMPQTAPR